MMLGFILLVIVAFYMFSSNNAEGPFSNRQSQARTSLDILNGRYARGEINREEYFERKRDLS